MPSVRKHGGHIVDAKGPTGTPFDYLLPQLKDKPGSHLPGDPGKVVADLNALGAAMVDEAPGLPTDPKVEVNSTVPALYTYWGQFIDHDLTANTDRDSRTSDITKADLKPVPPDEVTKNLRNLRRPGLDLDSVYGDGPSFGKDNDDDDHDDGHGPDDGLYDGPRFRVGRNHEQGIRGVKIPPVDDLARDLPRIGKLLDDGVITQDDLPEDLRKDPNLRTRAFIGDLRNDENLIIAQFHLAFLRFHNKVVERIEDDPRAFGLKRGRGHRAERFEHARQLTRFHYQWLVVNDYLKTVTLSGIVDKVLVGGLKHYKPLVSRGRHELFMPLEYSVAAFRFGHTMVRGAYDHNRNFGKRLPGQGEGQPLIPFASFDLLFAFTGNGFARDRNDPSKSIRSPFLDQGPALPFNWIIEWDRFANKADPDEAHFARKFDTRLVPPITQMVNEGTDPDIQDDVNKPLNKPLRVLLRHLARRNLLRGYLLSIPTGQSVAAEMGVLALTQDELRRDNSDALNAALEQGGFLQNTPLWYYLLKEAEVRASGNSLGELGSRIVCETVIGLLRNDRNSFLNDRGGWDPSEGVKLDNGDPIVTIRDFLSFTGVPA
jgi:hypothetical protein